MKFNIRRFIFIIPIALGMVACNSASEIEKKREQLNAYKTEYANLKNKINSLEKELAVLDPASNKQVAKLVKLDTVSAEDFSHYIDLQGMVESEEHVMVQPGMPGAVTIVNVIEGQPVKKGQVMAEIDNRAIKENIAQLQTNLDLAKTAFERQERLWNKKIGSEMQYLQAKTQYESMQKSIAALSAQLDMTRIKSPINGVVDQVNIKPGGFASPGFDGAFHVVNNKNMKVLLKVADSYLSKIKVGAPVSIYLKDINETVEGKVSFVGKAVNTMTRTFSVEVKIPDNGKDYRPNMLASVSINDENLKEVVCAPSNLIKKDTDGSLYILVAENKGGNLIARKKFVKTGISYGSKIVVTEGLEPGDKIIRAGNEDLVDGQFVKGA